MKFKYFTLCLLSTALAAATTWAEIDPARRTVPKRFTTDVPGKRFSVFAGDPERIQRANEVHTQDFDASIQLEQPEVSLTHLKDIAHRQPKLELKFFVQNKSNRSYTLSFPDAQRYDILIQDSEGNVLYVWSEDKMFAKSVGKSFVNPHEKLMYQPNPPIELTNIIPKLKPGNYTIVATLSNYPEIQAKADWTVLGEKPAKPAPEAEAESQPETSETPASER